MTFFKSLFGKPPLDADGLAPKQRTLLERAESTVRNYLDNGEQLPPFAMAVQKNGEVMSYLPSEEFQSANEAFVGIIRSLIPLARGRSITAAVLVTSMPGVADGEEASIMFDLEQAEMSRKLARLPYRPGQTGIEYGQMTFRDAKAKLFAS